MSPVAFHVAGRCSADALGAAVSGRSRRRRASALFVLAHGAGAGQSHPVHGALRARPRRARHRRRHLQLSRTCRPAARAPDRAPVLEDAFRRVIVVGGRAPPRAARHGCSSAASRWAAGWRRTWPPRRTRGPPARPRSTASSCSAIRSSPPGGLEAFARSRLASRCAIAVPTLIVQGTRDTFGGPDDIDAQGARQHAADRDARRRRRSLARRPQVDGRRRRLDATPTVQVDAISDVR